METFSLYEIKIQYGWIPEIYIAYFILVKMLKY